MTSTLEIPRLIEFRAKTGTGVEPGTIAGQAVPIGTEIDQGYIRHVIEPGCFAAQTKDPARVKIHWTHAGENVIGHLTALEETAAGYDYAGRIIDKPAVPNGQLALELLRSGVVDEVSVGFEWINYTEELITEGDSSFWLVRHTKARLYHLAVVPDGAAGRDATVKTVARRSRPTAAEMRATLGL